ncbi:MAG: hypothetical protein HKN87_19825 [Saprospiraceae bacterium]|nr:hypothetical protein [Saprospiraceae bacterium]
MNTILSILLQKLLLISFQCDFDVINKGHGGNNTNDLMSRVEDDVISEKPDIVIMMVGTNDMFWLRKKISYDKYSSNLEKLINRFKKNNIEVILVSPPPADTTYLFERHKRESFKESPNTKLEKVSKILNAKSFENNLLFVDVFAQFKNNGIPDHNKDIIIRNVFNSGAHDGVHPTPHGCKIIATAIFQKMIDNEKIKKGIKIICFGDSITFGAHVKGEGTASGETYPAYLKELICNYFKH